MLGHRLVLWTLLVSFRRISHRKPQERKDSERGVYSRTLKDFSSSWGEAIGIIDVASSDWIWEDTLSPVIDYPTMVWPTTFDNGHLLPRPYSILLRTHPIRTSHPIMAACYSSWQDPSHPLPCSSRSLSYLCVVMSWIPYLASTCRQSFKYGTVAKTHSSSNLGSYGQLNLNSGIW